MKRSKRWWTVGGDTLANRILLERRAEIHAERQFARERMPALAKELFGSSTMSSAELEKLHQFALRAGQAMEYVSYDSPVIGCSSFQEVQSTKPLGSGEIDNHDVGHAAAKLRMTAGERYIPRFLEVETAYDLYLDKDALREEFEASVWGRNKYVEGYGHSPLLLAYSDIQYRLALLRVRKRHIREISLHDDLPTYLPGTWDVVTTVIEQIIDVIESLNYSKPTPERLVQLGVLDTTIGVIQTASKGFMKLDSNPAVLLQIQAQLDEVAAEFMADPHTLMRECAERLVAGEPAQQLHKGLFFEAIAEFRPKDLFDDVG